MTEQLREQIDKEIEYLAYEAVVPITGNPTTPYEFGAIKLYKAILGLFADWILSLPEIKEALGKEPVTEPCPECGGSGEKNQWDGQEGWEEFRCPTCKGTGRSK